MIYPFSHPLTVLTPRLSAALRTAAAGAENRGALQPEQLDIIYRYRWFNLFVPQIYGGLGLSLPEALQLQEALAWTDGSLGWTVTLCSGAAWFAGFLEPSAAQAIFSNPKVCLAGSGQASGFAEVNTKGFRINGLWRYATGAPHATVFTANCVLQQNGVPLQDANGQTLVKAFWFHREEVQIHPDWHTIGLIATASHSFEVKEITVPFNRCFTIEPGRAVLPGMVFRYPFLPFAETTLAVNYSGLATRFTDLCRPSGALEEAKQKLGQVRVSFFRTAEDSWKELTENHTLTVNTITALGQASRQLAALSLSLVDELYPLCGLQAADPRMEINRVWRDLHTASQHVLLRADDTGLSDQS